MMSVYVIIIITPNNIVTMNVIVTTLSYVPLEISHIWFLETHLPRKTP